MYVLVSAAFFMVKYEIEESNFAKMIYYCALASIPVMNTVIAIISMLFGVITVADELTKTNKDRMQ